MTEHEEPGEGSNPALIRLATEIRRLRRVAGLSQRELAGLIGYSAQYVSLAERPKQLPSADLVCALDSVLQAHGELGRLRDAAASEQRMQRRRATTEYRLAQRSH